MLSLRAFARSAPRSISRLASTSIRAPIRQATVLQSSSWKPIQSQALAAFSTSRMRMAKESEIDTELVAKIESELQLESDMKDPESIPVSVKDYLENSEFEVIDTPGEEEVVLTRKYNNESITVTFSIADLHNMDPDADPYMENAQPDEEDLDSGNINQGSQRNFKETSEDQIEDGAEDGGEGEDNSFPVRVNIIVSKPKSGAMSFETVITNGTMMIENVYHYATLALAEAKTAEKVQERQTFYPGPPFSNLDEELQILLEKYLDERGVNTSLALFIPDYIEMKEQKEYLRWLSNVQKFVEA